jgi:carbonic anhydrase
MMTFTESAALAQVAHTKGEEGLLEVKDIDFNPFSVLEDEVKKEIAWLKTKKMEEGINITGWVYELETGRVRRVLE